MSATKGPASPPDANTKRTDESAALLAELTAANTAFRSLSADARRARVERDRLLAVLELSQARGSR